MQPDRSHVLAIALPDSEKPSSRGLCLGCTFPSSIFRTGVLEPLRAAVRHLMPRRHNHKGRSTTERFVSLPHYMLRSAAWRSLSPVARCIFIELAAIYNGSNNGHHRPLCPRCCRARPLLQGHCRTGLR